MATLSTPRTFRPALEIALQPFRRGHSRSPAEPGLQLLVAIARLPPFGVPPSPVESPRQLSFRSLRIAFPQIAEPVTNKMRHVDGFETRYVLLVLTQELATRGEVIVNHIKNLAVDSSHQTG